MRGNMTYMNMKAQSRVLIPSLASGAISGKAVAQPGNGQGWSSKLVRVPKATAHVENCTADKVLFRTTPTRSLQRQYRVRATVDDCTCDDAPMRSGWRRLSFCGASPPSHQAELRHVPPNGIAQGCRGTTGLTAPSLKRFCSTLLHKIGPAGVRDRVPAPVQVVDDVRVDRMTFSTFPLTVPTPARDPHPLPAHVRATEGASWQDQLFLPQAAGFCPPHQPSGTVQTSITTLLTLAGDGEGGPLPHPLLGQAVLPLPSGSNHSAQVEPSRVPRSKPSSHPSSVFLSPAIIFAQYQERRVRTGGLLLNAPSSFTNPPTGRPTHPPVLNGHRAFIEPRIHLRVLTASGASHERSQAMCD